MERENVDSKAVTSIGFDSSESTLEIEFKTTGAVWQYYEVPEFVFLEFKVSDSLGKYFNANIKNQYRGSQVG